MTETSNPRKLYQSGNGTVVSLPQDILDAVGLERGDRVVLESDGETITMEEAEFRRVTDE